MSWIDVAILALVVLIGLLGVWKGVKKGALSLGAFVISFLLAFFLANVIAEALLGVDSIKAFVLGNGVGEGADWSLASWIYGGINRMELKPNSPLYLNFYKPMLDIITKSNVGLDPEQGAALYMAFVMFAAIVGVGIFIVARLLLIIVTVLIKSYIPKKNTVMTRLFGFVVGAVRGALWAFALTLVFTCIAGIAPFTPGISKVQDEFQHNAVVCNYFEKGAYGLKNSMLLPDGDAYGRLVEMVYKKESVEDPNAEKLSGERLNLFINVSNLNYENDPWSLDSNRRRKFDEDGAKARVASEFASVGFDTVVQSILDYNKHLVTVIDDMSKLNELNEQFSALNKIVEPNDGMVTIDGLMKELWRKLRSYEQHYNRPNEEEEISIRNSTLSSDYKGIQETLHNIRIYYNAFNASSEDEIEVFPVYPDDGDENFNLPEQKRFTAED